MSRKRRGAWPSCKRKNPNSAAFLDELEALGVVPNGPLEGLCDFPSVRDGREVFLCWKLGEPEVCHWHEKNAGFAGRQSLDAPTIPVRPARRPR